MPRKLLKAVAAIALAGGAALYLDYRREMKRRGAALDASGRIAETRAGPIEYAREGEGEAALVIHGAGGGYDQGLIIGRDLFGAGFEIVAPSRFGYLRTPLPADASPAAQADAHVALLDALGIGRCVALGASAGAPSAIELALRHPDRVSALILLVPRTYDPSGRMGVDASPSSQALLKLIEASADFAFWLASRFARPAVVRFLGVPPELESQASPEDRERVSAIIRSIEPLSRRIAGLRADNMTELAPWPLESLAVPSLVVSAEDDLYQTLPGARFTADRIRGAELEILPSGGHLMIGRGEHLRELVARFLGRIRQFRAAA